MSLNYLTVQDLLFINFEVTGGKQDFDFARLEEAVNYQYASGQSNDIVAQAARFFKGFVKMAPFTCGNDECAFVGLAVFLKMNGKSLDLDESEVSAWCANVWSSGTDTRLAISEKLKDEHIHALHGIPSVAEITRDVLEEYAIALADISLETA